MANIYMTFLVLMFFISCKETTTARTPEKEEAEEEVVVNKIKKNSIPALQKKSNDSILTLAYNGADLGYLANKYYENKAYRHVLSAYNDFEDRRALDKKRDSIKIPELLAISRNISLPKLQTITKELDQIIKARALYIKLEKKLWELPKSSENRDFRKVPKAQKLELLGASKMLYESISNLGQNENPPKKAIGQFRQVAENLEDIAQGKIDENGYALDMVHQRLAHGLSNCIKWAKKK